MLSPTRTGNTMSKIMVFTMQKVGSSSVKRGLEEKGYEVDRAYEENILELPPLVQKVLYTLSQAALAWIAAGWWVSSVR